MVGDGDLRDDVGALGEANVDKALVLLQSFFNHLHLCVNVSQEEVLHPGVGERHGLQLKQIEQTQARKTLHAIIHSQR